MSYQNLQVGPEIESQVAFLDMSCLIFKRNGKELLGKTVEYHAYGLTFPSYKFPVVQNFHIKNYCIVAANLTTVL